MESLFKKRKKGTWKSRWLA